MKKKKLFLTKDDPMNWSKKKWITLNLNWEITSFCKWKEKLNCFYSVTFNRKREKNFFWSTAPQIIQIHRIQSSTLRKTTLDILKIKGKFLFHLKKKKTKILESNAKIILNLCKQSQRQKSKNLINWKELNLKLSARFSFRTHTELIFFSSL